MVGRILVNGNEAKPAKEVNEGDVITLTFSSRIIELKVLDMPTVTKKGSSASFVVVQSEKRLPKDEDLWSENP
jgi:ribosomal 50S subunit-recycling heat shock protein